MRYWQQVFTLLFIFFLVGCQKDNSVNYNQTQVLKVGICSDYPPFAYSKQGKLVGYDVDLLQQIAQEMGYEVVIQDMSHHNLIPALQSKKIDMAACALTVTPQRQQNIDFTQIYYQGSLAIIYRKGQQPDLNNLSHQKIGVQLGTTMEQTAKKLAKNFKNVEISMMDSNPALIEKLKLGEIDFIIIENLQATEFCKANITLAHQEIGKAEEGYGIALTKGSPLLTLVNTALSNLNSNGTLQTLEQKWELS